MKLKHIFRSRRVSARIFLFLSIILAVLAGLQSGYAHRALVQQTPMSNISKPAAPSICGPLGFVPTSYQVGAGPWSVVVGDFNSDGESDLVTVNSSSNDVSVLLGNGNGAFQNATSYPAGFNPASVAVADLFGDRIDDLVVANSFTDGGVSFLQGEGDGTFFPPYNFTMGSRPYSVAIGDFNSDSWPDIVTVSSSANNMSVRLNNGVGDLEPAIHIAIACGPVGVAVGDLNSDGKPDLVTVNSSSNSLSVLLGNGDGSFQVPINFTVGSVPVGVAIGDLNSDGKPDLVSANSSSDNMSVLLGNGDGLFQVAVNFGVGSAPVDVAVGDFNSDGKPDLVSANYLSNSLSVLLGNGDGSLQAAINFSIGYGTHSVAVGDFNSDGKPDLVSANYSIHSVSVLLNTCTSLTNTPTPTPVPIGTNSPRPTQTPGGPTATPPPLPTACSIQFTDVPSTNTFYPFVRCLACRGIISGYSCGGPGEPCNPQNDPYFRPGNLVTRGQLAKIVSNSAGFSDTPTGQIFQDVPSSSTFYLFVERLASRSVMAGYNCGGAGEPCGPANLPYFRPGAGATRGQLTKIVSNAAGFTDPAPSTYTFTDVPAGSTFHVYVERLLLDRPGVMGGYNCGGSGEPCDARHRPYFRPSKPLTRGQTSKIVGNTFFPNCQTPGR